MLQEFKSARYAVMFYRNSNSIGIRQKFGKNTQVISFGGRKCGLLENVLRGFGDDALRKLDAGQKETAVEKWAKKAVNGLDD